jgi:hypothetical protein
MYVDAVSVPYVTTMRVVVAATPDTAGRPVNHTLISRPVVTFTSVTRPKVLSGTRMEELDQGAGVVQRAVDAWAVAPTVDTVPVEPIVRCRVKGGVRLLTGMVPAAELEDTMMPRSLNTASPMTLEALKEVLQSETGRGQVVW